MSLAGSPKILKRNRSLIRPDVNGRARLKDFQEKNTDRADDRIWSFCSLFSMYCTLCQQLQGK